VGIVGGEAEEQKTDEGHAAGGDEGGRIVMRPVDEGVDELGHGIAADVAHVGLNVSDEFHGGEIEGGDSKEATSDGGDHAQQDG